MWRISPLADVLSAHFAGILNVVLVNAIFFRVVTTCNVTCSYLSVVSIRLGYDAVSLGEQLLRTLRIVLPSSSSSISPRISWTWAA